MSDRDILAVARYCLLLLQQYQWQLTSCTYIQHTTSTQQQSNINQEKRQQFSANTTDWTELLVDNHNCLTPSDS